MKEQNMKDEGMNLPIDDGIGAHLVANAEEQIRQLCAEIRACHPDDTGRRNRLQERLEEAEKVLRFRREMHTAA